MFQTTSLTSNKINYFPHIRFSEHQEETWKQKGICLGAESQLENSLPAPGTTGRSKAAWLRGLDLKDACPPKELPPPSAHSQLPLSPICISTAIKNVEFHRFFFESLIQDKQTNGNTKTISKKKKKLLDLYWSHKSIQLKCTFHIEFNY